MKYLAQLSDIGYEGNNYTWSNNQQGRRRIWERLDIVLLNGEANTELPAIKVKHLSRTTSDHARLLVEIKENIIPKVWFIFLKMWMEHHTFNTLIETSWNAQVNGAPGYIFSEKLKKVTLSATFMLRKYP